MHLFDIKQGAMSQTELRCIACITLWFEMRREKNMKEKKWSRKT